MSSNIAIFWFTSATFSDEVKSIGKETKKNQIFVIFFCNVPNFAIFFLIVSDFERIQWNVPTC